MKKRGLVFILILIVCVLCIGCRHTIVYRNTIGFAFGSIRIIIYDNGDVMEDKEIESPNHKENYKKIRKLSNEQMNQLKEKIEEETDNEKLEKFVNLMIYGKESPGNMGF